MSKLRWIAGLLCFFVLLNCFAEELDGNFFYKACRTQDPVMKEGCMAFVTGFFCGVVVQAAKTKTPVYVCVPGGVTPRQFMDLLVKYLSNHPEKRHLHGIILFADVLETYFPCSKEQKKLPPKIRNPL